MGDKHSIYRGCLLGLAVGDAMGYTVDSRSYDEIRRDYGPGGLQGYDLVNGYADVTSYTQLAAFGCNALLLAMTLGQLQGRMAPLIRYVSMACREWAQGQRHYSGRGKTYCWVYQSKEMRARRCMDTRMLETLSMETLGTLEDPINRYTTPGALTLAVPVGLFSDMGFLERSEAVRLGAEAVALTQGGQKAFLTGAMVTHIVAALAAGPSKDLKTVFTDAANRVREQFGAEYPQVEELCNYLRHALTLAGNRGFAHAECMERLECVTAGQVLAGAVYACLASGGDFDTAMIIAVNHSGRSAAVGALVGAILGARLGEEALPEFYLECLEPVELLRELADDLIQGCPMELGKSLFDDDWDRKYIHGGL